MGGMINVGGLASGLDTENIIRQLVQLERQPIRRYQNQISDLEDRKEALSGLRGTLQTLMHRAQDFRLTEVFNQDEASVVNEDVLTAEVSGGSPAEGSYSVEVIQLASATVANSSGAMGGSINPSAALDSSGIKTGVTAGTFTINGQEFTVDPATDSLDSVLAAINGSGAGVTATYDPGTDKVTIANATPGDGSIINFGASGDTSNLLDAIGVEGAYQYTNGSGSTETVSTSNLGAVSAGDTLDSVNFAAGAATSGTFSINGVEIAVDTATDSLGDVISAINASDAGVTASYNSTSDSITVVSDELGSREINFSSGTSNFLDVTNLSTATQVTGSDSQFRVNGGAVQSRNSNTVTDAIDDVSLTLVEAGTTTVNVAADEEAIVADVQEFVDAFNTAMTELHDLSGVDGELAGESGLRFMKSAMASMIFDNVGGASGDYANLLGIGISTGDSFNAEAAMQLEIDEDALLEALRDDPEGVQALFTNDSEDGVANRFEDYLDAMTGLDGFLNSQTKANGSIDTRIRNLNDRIDRTEERVLRMEDRMRAQFTNMEQLVSSFQSQSNALMGLMGGGGF